MTNIKKHGVILPISIEAALDQFGAANYPKRVGRFRKLTAEERADWEKARDAIKLLENNPWVYWDRDDGPVLEKPRKWVTDE